MTRFLRPLNTQSFKLITEQSPDFLKQNNIVLAKFMLPHISEPLLLELARVLWTWRHTGQQHRVEAN
jgi:hypothetical protein